MSMMEFVAPPQKTFTLRSSSSSTMPAFASAKTFAAPLLVDAGDDVANPAARTADRRQALRVRVSSSATSEFNDRAVTPARATATLGTPVASRSDSYRSRSISNVGGRR